MMTAAAALEVPESQMQEFFDEVLAGKHGKIAVAYYGGATKPAIQGFDLLRLMGKLDPPSARHRQSRW